MIRRPLLALLGAGALLAFAPAAGATSPIVTGSSTFHGCTGTITVGADSATASVSGPGCTDLTLTFVDYTEVTPGQQYPQSVTDAVAVTVALPVTGDLCENQLDVEVGAYPATLTDSAGDNSIAWAVNRNACATAPTTTVAPTTTTLAPVTSTTVAPTTTTTVPASTSTTVPAVTVPSSSAPIPPGAPTAAAPITTTAVSMVAAAASIAKAASAATTGLAFTGSDTASLVAFSVLLILPGIFIAVLAINGSAARKNRGEA